jgi:hypothetical protein
MIISNDLIEQVLIAPIRDGCNALWVVSGYSSPSMFHAHKQWCREHDLPIPEVSLVVGMTARDGLSRVAHEGFSKLARVRNSKFECRYLTGDIPVHSKVYAWTRDGVPVRGFIGSANYSQTAFSNHQEEVLHEIDAEDAELYVHEVTSRGISCLEENISELVTLHELTEPGHTLPARRAPQVEGGADLQTVSLQLFTDRGGRRVPDKSQLNWGQRPGRNRNQAYIAVPMRVHELGFFPDLAVHFTVMTDDGEVLDCVRAQEWGKAIETPESNAILGEYFRRRLGVPLGDPVTFEDLERYGRADVSFTRISDTEFYLDFSSS